MHNIIVSWLQIFSLRKNVRYKITVMDKIKITIYNLVNIIADLVV